MIDQQFLIVTQEEILNEMTYQLEAKHRNFINNYQPKDEQVKDIKTRSFLKYLRYQALVGREYVAQLNWV